MLIKRKLFQKWEYEDEEAEDYEWEYETEEEDAEPHDEEEKESGGPPDDEEELPDPFSPVVATSASAAHVIVK